MERFPAQSDYLGRLKRISVETSSRFCASNPSVLINDCAHCFPISRMVS